jgi:hypothetical protein
MQEIDWLHKYLSYDLPRQAKQKSNPSDWIREKITLMDKKKPDVETTGLN